MSLMKKLNEINSRYKNIGELTVKQILQFKKKRDRAWPVNGSNNREYWKGGRKNENLSNIKSIPEDDITSYNGTLYLHIL